jgi:hypothetical protein
VAGRSKRLDWALEEAAVAATPTNDVYLKAQYRRLRPRRGHKKALGAVKHSIIIACRHMLTTGELYDDLGGSRGIQEPPYLYGKVPPPGVEPGSTA